MKVLLSIILAVALLGCEKTYPPGQVGSVISATAQLSAKGGSSSPGTARISINTVFGESPSITVFGSFSNLSGVVKKVVLKGLQRTCEVTQFLDLNEANTSGRVDGECNGPLTQKELDQLRVEGNWSVVLSTAQSPEGELEGSLTFR
jgi:hypothetical protein